MTIPLDRLMTELRLRLRDLEQTKLAATLAVKHALEDADLALVDAEELKRLRADNYRLQSALDEIAYLSAYTRSGGASAGDLGSYEAGLDKAIEIACAALNLPETDK